jgi:hypothetical protein
VAAQSGDDDVDALYRRPVSEFIAARNALAKRLRAGADSDAAGRIKALARPSLSAWAVNQLWWNERDAFERLLRAASRIRLAQTRGAGPTEQRSADRDKRAAHNALLEAAEQILGAAGHGTSASTMRRISTSLEAAAAHGADTLDPPLGRLSADLEPPGFDLVGALGASMAPPEPETEPEPEPDAAAAQRQVAEANLVAATERAQAAARAVDDAQHIADEARAYAQHSLDSAATARAQANAAAKEADRLEVRAATAKREAEARETALVEARRILDAAEKAVRAAEQRAREID